jgi:hypothetical protein
MSAGTKQEPASLHLGHGPIYRSGETVGLHRDQTGGLLALVLVVAVPRVKHFDRLPYPGLAPIT